MTIYAESRPDFYQKRFDVESYRNRLQELADVKPSRCLPQYHCVTDRGLAVVHVIRYLWENFKGKLGFENGVTHEKVQAEWLKFLHYGLQEGYFQKPEIAASLGSLRRKISDPTVERTINIILDDQGDKIVRVRRQLIQYCQQHAEHLQPALWNQLLYARAIRPLSQEFGETYLALAQQGAARYLSLEEGIAYLYRAASCQFSLSASYSGRLESCFNTLKERVASPEGFFCRRDFSYVQLQMGERKHHQNKPQDALVHLAEARQVQGGLSTYYSYLEFINSAQRLSPTYAGTFDSVTGWRTTCLDNCSRFLQHPPEFPEDQPELRSAYATALVTLGDYHLSSSVSTGSKLKSFLGLSEQQKSALKNALDCYTRALQFSEGAQERVVVAKVWGHLDTMRGLGVNLEEFRQTTTTLALRSRHPVIVAQQSLLCLKCFPTKGDLVALPEWITTAERFADAMAQIYRNKAHEKHFVLLDFALELVKEAGPVNLRKFVEILCDRLSVDDLRNSGEDIWRFRNNAYNIGLEYKKEKKWEKAARQFLIYIECAVPEDNEDWVNCCKLFARCLSKAYAAPLKDPTLLDQAILYHSQNGPVFFKFLELIGRRLKRLPTPSIQMSPEVRALFVDGMMRLGHTHLEQAKSTSAKGLKIVTLGIVNRQQKGSLQALDYYILASDFAEGSKRAAIARVLCKNLCLDDIRAAGINLVNFRQGAFEVAHDEFKKQEWENAAHHFLLCLKCFSPEELAQSLEGAKITQFLAKALGEIFKSNQLKQEHLLILDQAIAHRMMFTEKNIRLFIKEGGKTDFFLVDQGACLYYLRGVIRESLSSYSKDEVLEDFISACKIAPHHPWGAWGYFAVDGQLDIDKDASINAYRSNIMAWGGDTLPAVHA